MEVRLPESQFSFNSVVIEARKPDLFQRMIGSEVGPRPTQENCCYDLRSALCISVSFLYR